MKVSFASAARRLAAIGRRFHGRCWALGTGGNFSAVIAERPFRLAITTSGSHKGVLGPRDVLVVDDAGRPVGRAAARAAKRPSAETALHLEIVRRTGARAVLHTHSVWATILSDVNAEAGGFAIEGYEMLKGLDGVTTHEHREWIPIVPNEQNVERLARSLGAVLEKTPAPHGVLIRRHGLYTWGASLAAAERHVETLEFLLEIVGRTRSLNAQEVHDGTAQDS